MSLTSSPRARFSLQERRLRRPRLGFLGVGWIGLLRLRSLLDAEVAEVMAVVDSDTSASEAALKEAAGAVAASSFEELLDWELDGVVISTPSSLHAEQAITALEHGLAVFCQKPLARTERETQEVVAAAAEVDCLLGVDFSYRHVSGVERMRQLVQEGRLGEIFAVDLTFHNAYGPDKAWFRDPVRSGGGCVIDLGIHLVDLAQWILGDADVRNLHSHLWQHGRPIEGRPAVVEDCAVAEWEYPGGTAARLACSWNLSAGKDAVIEAVFYGTEGAVALRNVNGSFFDFVVEHCQGTQRRVLAGPPDDWGGRALIDWTERLAAENSFDGGIRTAVDVARVIDGIYRR